MYPGNGWYGAWCTMGWGHHGYGYRAITAKTGPLRLIQAITAKTGPLRLIRAITANKAVTANKASPKAIRASPKAIRASPEVPGPVEPVLRFLDQCVLDQ